jgi:hypothetical protein
LAVKDDLQFAQDNETKAREASDKAAGAVRTARAARDALIGDAASGKPVNAADVRPAEEATRSAEIDAEIAARVASTALRLRHEAEIQNWHAEAAMLDERIQDGEAAVVAAGASVDAAFAELQRAVDFFNTAGINLWSAREAASHFNGNVEVRKSHNPVLAAGGPVTNPVARGSSKVWNFARVEAMVYNHGSIREFRGHQGLLAAREAASLRRPDLLKTQISETI